jgi:hypothetical protein
MIHGIHLEVLLAVAYSLFLAGVASVLESVARRSYRRAADYRNSGFIYFGELDYWECPAGHQLVQLQTDHHRKVTTYRAPASACNSCSLKLNCTDSDAGRTLERRFDLWIESELRRFHRGISLSLLFLASILLATEVFRYSLPRERTMLVGLLLLLAFAQWKLLPSLGIALKFRGAESSG